MSTKSEFWGFLQTKDARYDRAFIKFVGGNQLNVHYKDVKNRDCVDVVKLSDVAILRSYVD